MDVLMKYYKNYRMIGKLLFKKELVNKTKYREKIKKYKINN